jgi:hypothetical protein
MTAVHAAVGLGEAGPGSGARGVVPSAPRAPPTYGAEHERRTPAAPAPDRWGPGRGDTTATATWAAAARRPARTAERTAGWPADGPDRRQR